MALKTKNRHCAQCRKKIKSEDALIGGLRAFCSYGHLQEWMRSDSGKEKLKKQVSTQRRAELTKTRNKHKSKGDLMREAQTAFNAYVRYRDRDKGCISCGARPGDKHGGSMDAGHYLARGSSKGNKLRYHLWNCYKQCVKCNRYLSGNTIPYRENLIHRYGKQRVEWLESGQFNPEYSRDYLLRIKKIFTKRLAIKKKINKSVV